MANPDRLRIPDVCFVDRPKQLWLRVTWRRISGPTHRVAWGPWPTWARMRRALASWREEQRRLMFVYDGITEVTPHASRPTADEYCTPRLTVAERDAGDLLATMH